MAIFPKIQNPCPFQNNIASLMDGDMCRMCKRQVFDLTDMADAERISFIKGCKEEVCVTYRLPAALAAAAVATAMIATPLAAAAQDVATLPDSLEIDAVITTGGGIKDLAKVQFFELAADKAIPDLPIVYEDEKTEAKPKAKS